MKYWFLAAVLAVGCTQNTVPPPKPGSGAASAAPAESDEVAEERAKLSPEDRKLVEAQEWCVVSNDERLGSSSMGPPIKLDVKGQAVFICCAGCKRKALENPEKTLAKLEELKKKKAESKR